MAKTEIRIDGDTKLRKKLEELRKKSEKEDKTVIVGFTMEYAPIVHETHKTKSKFLESPARRLRSELVRVMVKVYDRHKSLIKAILVAGLRLQREAQRETPVDTGALKASAYTAKISDAPMAAKKAFARGDDKRRYEEASRRSKK